MKCGTNGGVDMKCVFLCHVSLHIFTHINTLTILASGSVRFLTMSNWRTNCSSESDLLMDLIQMIHKKKFVHESVSRMNGSRYFLTKNCLSDM